MGNTWTTLAVAAFGAALLTGGCSEEASGESDSDTQQSSAPASSVSALIGREGGVLELPSGARVVIPPDALLEELELALAEVGPGELAARSDALDMLETPVALTPHGTKFQRTVQVKLPRTRQSQGVDDRQLRLIRMDDETARDLEQIEDMEIAAKDVRFGIDRFSIYVIGRVAVQVSGSTGDAGGNSGGQSDASAGADSGPTAEGGASTGMLPDASTDASPDATADATADVVVPPMCPMGFDECDGLPGTQCETDLSLVTSCGDCDTACNGANGEVQCQAEGCVITDCNPGFGNCDTEANTGCEETLTSNASHCGACGRDCAAAGSTCDVDRCAEITLHASLPIGSDNSNALTWSYGDGAFFQIGYNNYNVRRIPEDGSTVTTRWSAAAAGGRFSLIANDDEVIWTQRGTPSVVLRKAHGTAAGDLPETLFEPAYQPYHLMVHGNAYYWMSGDYQSGDPVGYVYTRSVSAGPTDPGTAIVSVDQGSHGAVRAFTASDDALYWFTTDISPYEIRTTPLAGGTPTVVPVGPAMDAQLVQRIRLRTVGTTLYYNQDIGTSFTNGIYRWNPGDLTPTQLVAYEGVEDLVVDADAIYFVAGSRTYRAPLDGGAAVEISDVGGARILRQDADSLYVARSTCCVTTLYRIIK